MILRSIKLRKKAILEFSKTAFKKKINYKLLKTIFLSLMHRFADINWLSAFSLLHEQYKRNTHQK